MKSIGRWLIKRTRPAPRQRGQALVEYGLILALVALVAAVGLNTFAGGVGGLYDILEAAADAMASVL